MTLRLSEQPGRVLAVFVVCPTCILLGRALPTAGPRLRRRIACFLVAFGVVLGMYEVMWLNVPPRRVSVRWGPLVATRE